MSSNFGPDMKYITEGEPVSPGVTNRPLITLANEVNSLWAALRNVSAGQALVASKVTTSASVTVGMPVYFNTTTKQFEPALAQIGSIDATGSVSINRTGEWWGLVKTKHTSVLADIVFTGYSDIDISSVTGSETLAAGTYYLSTMTPGRLTKNRPGLALPVLRADGQGNVLVVNQILDQVDRHNHYRFELACRPSGEHSPPSPGERHTITDTDNNIEGWLPVSDPIFESKAPAGAVFGYNLKANTNLDNTWPPLPLKSATLEWDKGLSIDVGITGVPENLCVIDSNGIWWMSDCYGDVPWPREYTQATSVSDSSSVECPRTLSMSLVLWFNRISYANDNAVVESIHSKDGRLKTYCAGTSTEAHTGKLEIAFEFALEVVSDQSGYQAIKEFDTATGKFKAGPVLEGLYSTSSSVTLSGDTTKIVEIDGVNQTLYQGKVRLGIAPKDSLELELSKIRLDSAQQEYYEDTPYISFPAGEASSTRGVIFIPTDTEINSPKIRFRFRFLGTVAGTLPNLTLTARRVPRPVNGISTPAALPTSVDEAAVSLSMAGVLASAYQYVEATSSAFTVAAGDMVLFSLSRDDSDGYLGDVGMLHGVGVLAS